ncbi:MAG: WYL domain-containing protein [Desulfoplanes sp.]|nr:WYL domain-containing protein [Desulfoplanes sp.]MDD4649763.1 WYL domain-containing protein [Desulfoplanes sp.]
MRTITRNKQLQRIILMYQEIKTHPELTGHKLWGQLGISRTQFSRDKKFLEALGFFFHHDPREKHYVIDKDTTIPLSTLSLDKILALFLLLGQIGKTQESYLSNCAQDAARQLMSATDKELCTTCRDLLDQTGIPPIYGCPKKILVHLQKDIALRNRIIVEYTKPGHNPMSYTIHPFQLYTYAGSLYLDAKCVERKEMRCFKACRITSITSTHLRFSPCKEYDFKTFHNGSFGIFSGDTPQWVRIRFSPKAAPYIREEFRHPSQKITNHADGSLTFAVEVTEPREVYWWAARWGAECEVMEPGWLREEVRKTVKNMHAIYNTTSSSKHIEPGDRHNEHHVVY